MATLPTVGEDQNAWGDELNEYLEVEHESDGTHSFVYTEEGIVCTEAGIITV